MEVAKRKITECVKDYIKLYPEEWVAFQHIVEEKRAGLSDTRFGVAKESGNQMRALFEMPETLHSMIVMKLSDEEIEWFKSGGESKKEGARWFATKFPAFKIPDYI